MEFIIHWGKIDYTIFNFINKELEIMSSDTKETQDFVVGESRGHLF